MQTLHPYQAEDVDWMVDKRRMILANEVGLGKTLTAVHAAERLGGVCLIVCPKSVIPHWTKTVRENGNPNRYTIINYERLTEVINADFDTLILDESIAVKNVSAQRTINAVGAALCCCNVFFLTATPVRNHEADLFVPLYCCLPELRIVKATLPRSLQVSRETFVQTFFHVDYRPVSTRWGTNWVEQIRGIKPSMKEEFRELVSRVMISRDESYLPQKLLPLKRTIITLPWSPAQREFYDGVLEGVLKTDPNATIPTLLAQFVRLRQAALDSGIFLHPMDDFFSQHSSSKTNWLWQDKHTNRKPTLIFSTSVEYLMRLARVMSIYNANGGVEYEPAILHGGMSTRQRELQIEYFNQGYTNYFLISDKAGGVGLNLQRATRVVWCDLPWTPDILIQGTGRSRRQGQTREVEEIILMMEGPNSIDEKIWGVLQRKGRALSRVKTMRAVLHDLKKGV